MRPKNVCAGLATICFVIVLAGPAAAVDGVIEISRAAAVAGGVTPGDVPGFPITLSTSGSYRLTSDLSFTVQFIGQSQNFAAIEITAPRVTLDLNGFAVACRTSTDGRCPGTVSGIEGAGSDQSTLLNGVVRGWPESGAVLGERARVIGVHAFQNLGGLAVGEESLVESCVVTHNALSGLSTGRKSLVRGNVVSNNGTASRESGISTSDSVMVLDNVITDNSGFGIDTFNVNFRWTYRNNMLRGNNGGAETQVGLGAVNLGSNYCGTDTICP